MGYGGAIIYTLLRKFNDSNCSKKTTKKIRKRQENS
jgi:hypothetical protein